MIVEELYDALIEAGASEEKARAASRAVADMEGHFANIERAISGLDQKIERGISGLDQKIDREIARLDQNISEFRSEVDLRFSEFRSYVDQRFTRVEATLQLHKWMLGTILAFIILCFSKSLAYDFGYRKTMRHSTGFVEFAASDLAARIAKF